MFCNILTTNDCTIYVSCFILMLSANINADKLDKSKDLDSSFVKISKRDIGGMNIPNTNQENMYHNIGQNINHLKASETDLKPYETESVYNYGDFDQNSEEDMTDDKRGGIDRYSFFGSLGKRGRLPMGFYGQLGKRAPLGFYSQLGKRAPLGFRSQLGKRMPMGFVGQLGKRPSSRLPIGFVSQLGKRPSSRLPMGFVSQLGKRVPMGFVSQLGKRMPMGFINQLGKRSDGLESDENVYERKRRSIAIPWYFAQMKTAIPSRYIRGGIDRYSFFSRLGKRSEEPTSYYPTSDESFDADVI